MIKTANGNGSTIILTEPGNNCYQLTHNLHEINDKRFIEKTLEMFQNDERRTAEIKPIGRNRVAIFTNCGYKRSIRTAA